MRFVGRPTMLLTAPKTHKGPRTYGCPDVSMWLHACQMTRGGLCVQERFIGRLTGLLTAAKVNKGIQGRWMSYLQQMDSGLAAKVG